MADKKNAWGHILDTNQIGAEGSPVKVDMQCGFEDTYAQFLVWVQATFKNPDTLPLSVAVGQKKPEPGQPNIYCTFEGSIAQFCEFMQETFRRPDDLPCCAAVGNAVPAQIPGIPGKKARQYPGIPAPLQRFVSSGAMTTKNVAEIVAAYDGGNKIGAIKLVREFTGCGLKDAKEVVDQFPNRIFANRVEEEIPF